MRRALLSVLLFGILAVTIVPTYGWVIPPNPTGEDYKYELYGPHVKGIVIKIYANTAAEWTAMAANQLDLEDWALDAAHATAWSTPNGPITEANYGGDDGYYLLDINNNATFTPADNVTGTHNPTSELILRQALAYAVNRADIVDFTGGLTLPMYTPVPNYMSGYVNHDIDPAGNRADLTYGGYTGDSATANALLDANGYTIDGSGWRIDPVSQGGTGAELNLIFYSRSGDRGTFGDHYNNTLNSVLHIKTTYYSKVPRSDVTGPVFAQEYFNLYTGGWIFIGPDPDFLCDLYNGSNYYHPGSPENYDGINYTDLNADLTSIKLATSFEQGKTATLNAQVKFAQHCAAVPLWCYTGVKAYKNVPVEGGGNWTGLVNQKVVGVNSWWSTLNMYQTGALYPNNYTYYGFSSTVTLQNIVYAQWYWDTEVLGRIYDSGARRDPMTLATWVPQLYKNWVIGTWKDPTTGLIKTKVTVTLRPDAYWQDGQPVTAADVLYTLTEINKDMIAKGFPPAWWYPTVQYMKSVEMLDPYNIEILLSVNSVWAVGWVIGSVVIPKHIWKPIVDASISPTNHPYIQGVRPDPNIIGSGPFRWSAGFGDTVGSTVVMVANTPGSVVNGLTSPGYYLYNPICVDINPDNGYSKINLAPADTSVVANITITIRNLYQGGTLNGDKYVYVNDMLQTGYPHLGVTLPPVQPWNTSNPYPADPAGAAHVETVHLNFSQRSLNFVKAAFKVTGPSTLPDGEANPWLGTWVNVTLPIWATQRLDIAGTTLYDVLGYSAYPSWLKNDAPAPDLKVDGKDISKPAHAFGSYPGAPTWNLVADANGDYKIDGKDLGAFASQFGW
jgi:ABC-type transport system substrate-binding protein